METHWLDTHTNNLSSLDVAFPPCLEIGQYCHMVSPIAPMGPNQLQWHGTCEFSPSNSATVLSKHDSWFWAHLQAVRCLSPQNQVLSVLLTASQFSLANRNLLNTIGDFETNGALVWPIGPRPGVGRCCAHAQEILAAYCCILYVYTYVTALSASAR